MGLPQYYHGRALLLPFKGHGIAFADGRVIAMALPHERHVIAMEFPLDCSKFAIGLSW